jgi:8-oxo-dGTP pyrophosphatase MutT (NUDIX family)
MSKMESSSSSSGTKSTETSSSSSSSGKTYAYLMPVAYASSTETLWCMVGLKKWWIGRIKGKPFYKRKAWNSPGQWVMSGGAVDKTDSDPIAAACREFYEETYCTFRSRDVNFVYKYTTSGFTGCVVLMDSVEALNSLALKINAAILVGNPPDDELQCVAVKKASELPTLFTTVNAPPTSAYKNSTEQAYLAERANADRGWYVMILRDLLTDLQLMPTSSSSSSEGKKDTSSKESKQPKKEGT